MEADNALKPLSLDIRAYRFFPKRQQQKTKHEKSGTRFFFYGQVQHDEYQQKKLKEFHEYCHKHKKQYDKEIFNEQKLLLFLAGNGYKPDKCLTAMKNHLDFRGKYLPCALTAQLQEILKSGFFYISGRDINFRPIVIFNLKLIDFKRIQLYLRGVIYAQQQVIKYFMLPGQVQNWIVIYDLMNMGITDLPMGTLKDMIGVVSANYGGRLYRLFTVNAPGTIYFSWQAVKGFLDPVTVEKITIAKTNTDKKLWDLCKPSQIEQKYGGTQPNREKYFPFEIPDSEVDESRLVSNDKYEQMIKSNYLKNNQIDPKYK